MSKVIGATVGPPTPRSDFNQKNPKKADFIKNNPLPDITEADEGKFLCVSGGKLVPAEVKSGEGGTATAKLYKHTIRFIGETIYDDGGNEIIGGKRYEASFIDGNPEPYAESVDAFEFDFSVLNETPINEYDIATGEILGSYKAFAGHIDYDQFGLLCFDGSVASKTFDWEGEGLNVTDTVELIGASGGAGANEPLTFTGAVNAVYDGTQPIEVKIPNASGGGGKVWEKIYSITLTEAVTSFEITTDSNGNAFKLADINININTNYQGNLGSTSIESNQGRLAYIANGNRVAQYYRQINGGTAISMFGTAADSVSESGWNGYKCTGSSNVTKITIKANLAKGIDIVIWGVRV